MMRVIGAFSFVPGQPVLCQFDDGDTIEGNLHFEDEGRIWFCHDHPYERHGNLSPELHGRKYSWVFRYEDGGFTENIEMITPIGQTGVKFKQIEMCDNLRKFFTITTCSNIQQFLKMAVKPFEFHNYFTASTTPGMVIVSGFVDTVNGRQQKTVEIKLGRLIKKIADTVDPDGNIFRVTDAVIEKLHNSYVAFQNGKGLDLEILTGEDILKAYKTSNYSHSRVNTLHKSCMNDKFGFLNIYTKNKQVSVAVIRSEQGIEARCLVWQIDDKFYFDRIYYTCDWLENVLQEKLLEKGYINLITYFENSPGRYIKVVLDKTEFESYPYLDSFKWLNVSEDALYFVNEAFSVTRILPRGEYLKLTRTGGTHETHSLD